MTVYITLFCFSCQIRESSKGLLLKNITLSINKFMKVWYSLNLLFPSNVMNGMSPFEVPHEMISIVQIKIEPSLNCKNTFDQYILGI